MGAGCKPAGFCLRWFESNTLHQPIRQANAGTNARPAGASDGRLGRMPSTSTTLSVRERPASRAGLGCGQAPRAAVRACLVRGARISAGVAQLVERQPSKLNVASSNLVSRSVLFLNFGAPTPKFSDLLALCWRAVFGRPNPKTGQAPAFSRIAGLRGTPSRVSAAVLSCFAHLAQLVEHVLGKDEVTSSILVVGSKRLRHASRLADGRPVVVNGRVARRSAVAVVCSGAGVITEPATH
jgi:hypothetical protein